MTWKTEINQSSAVRQCFQKRLVNILRKVFYLFFLRKHEACEENCAICAASFCKSSSSVCLAANRPKFALVCSLIEFRLSKVANHSMIFFKFACLVFIQPPWCSNVRLPASLQIERTCEVVAFIEQNQIISMDSNKFAKVLRKHPAVDSREICKIYVSSHF